MIVKITSTGTRKVPFWRQERMVLDLTTSAAYVDMFTSIQQQERVARYLPVNGHAIIDVTDYLRTYGNCSSITLTTTAGNYTVNFTRPGLIDPKKLLIPDHDLQNVGGVIIPPSKIIAELNQEGREFFAVYLPQDRWIVLGQAQSTSVEVGNIDGDFSLYNEDEGEEKKYKPQKMECEKRYALVEWVTITGVESAAWFEIKEQEQAAKNGFSLLNLNNEYKEVPGRVDALTLRLDGLDLYDLWYYGGIITSPKVSVAMISGETEYEQTQVEITDKALTVPTGGAGFDGVFEFSINWRRYDAVNL